MRPRRALAADAALLDRMREHTRRAVSRLLQDTPGASCLLTPDTPRCDYHLLAAVLDRASIAAVRRAPREEDG
jgi:hypothetical protein